VLAEAAISKPLAYDKVLILPTAAWLAAVGDGLLYPLPGTLGKLSSLQDLGHAFSSYFPRVKVLLKTVFKVRSGLQRLSHRIIGSNTLMQGALPGILTRTPEKFYEGTVRTLQVG